MAKIKPSEPDRPIIGFIAGSFRPPNRRHWQMISYFSDLVGDDGTIIVVVSNPQKAKHHMNDGSEISTIDAISVLEIFRDSEQRDNVLIMESESPSPITSVYGMITDPDTVSDSDVLVCCYKDARDLGKWSRLPSMVEEKNPGITLIDPNKYAFRRSYENYAHGISNLQKRSDTVTLSDEGSALPDFLSDSEKKRCLKIIYGDSKAIKGKDKDGKQINYDYDEAEQVNESGAASKDGYRRFESPFRFAEFMLKADNKYGRSIDIGSIEKNEIVIFDVDTRTGGDKKTYIIENCMPRDRSWITWAILI